MEEQASFGSWVRRQRKALDLTQEALAERVGCALDTIRKIESGARRPSRQVAQRLADQLALPSDLHTPFLHAARSDRETHRLGLATTPVPPLVSIAVGQSQHRQAAASHPTGTLTFLCSDIEGTTQLWEQYPIAMPAALAQHDSLLQQTMTVHRGIVLKHTGDSMYAVFARADDALAAAVAAQQALIKAPWGETGPLKVRMILHTGVAEEREDAYIGPALNRARRLLDVGYGGQILLSHVTQELVYDHLPHEVTLHDLGTHRLKDLIRPEHIFQVTAPNLPASFPALRTLDSHQHNLPAQMTPLIGRKTEIIAVCNRLRLADVRLLTLTGPGGTGKTRLALQSAAELLDDFADGVYFVNLAPISDPTLVIAAIAQTLDVKETGAQPLVERLKTYLKSKKQLLLLDNFEQILEAGSLVADLLAAAPNLKVLTTSRAVLHVYGEHEFVVPPLEVPNPSRLPDKDAISQYDAVRLFIEQAQSVKADFHITNANAPAVAEICYRLDGLPLAIELAAARSKLFAPEALLVRLSNRLQLLTGGARTLPVRQQTLRNTIDWSYTLLTSDEQALFRRLAVFVSGCTIAAAEAVCNAECDLGTDVLDSLTSLANKSLLRQIEGLNGEPRFTMFETIREYGLELLQECGEIEIMRRQYGMYYVTLVEIAGSPALTREKRESLLKQLEVEHYNLRAVLQQSLSQSGDISIGLCLGRVLHRYWYTLGYVNEGSAWITALLQRPESMDDSSIRAALLIGAGSFAELQSDYEQAARFLEQSVELYRELGDKLFLSQALGVLGSVVAEYGNRDRGKKLIEEQLEIARESNNIDEIASAFNNFGFIARLDRDYDQAIYYFNESIALYKQLGVDVGRIIGNLATVARAQGDYLQAISLFKQALHINQNRKDPARFWDIYDLALVAALQGELIRATKLFGVVERIYEETGMPRPPDEDISYTNVVNEIHAQMDENTFKATWAEGKMMSLDEAVIYALE